MLATELSLHIHGTGKTYEFLLVNLVFDEQTYSDAFARKNNKTVDETLGHGRYAMLRATVENHYPNSLGQPLGTFLIELKMNGDYFYRSFLNEYGDDTYSIFKIADKAVWDRRGIYAFTVDDSLKYIGRCRDSMRKRINQGYGKIHPKNCYKDGQATNCHLNALITKNQETVQLWFCELDLVEVKDAERILLAEYNPPWNIQRG